MGHRQPTDHVEDQQLEQDYIELKGKPILASCSYNIHRRQPPPVSDQRVRFVLTPRNPDGDLQIRLQKHGRAFWATIQMNGLVTITESADGRTASGSINLSRQLAPLRVGEVS